MVPALALEHRVVAIDLPGHGATTRPFTAPLLNGYAALVLEVLDDLGVTGPVSLIGNSMGAAVRRCCPLPTPSASTAPC